VRAVRDAWTRWGLLPAAVVVPAFFLVALALVLAFDDRVRAVGGLVLAAALVSYCVARPSGGWDLFWVVAIPNAAATIAHDVVGAPRWIGVVLVPFVLWEAWRMDRAAGRTAESDGVRAG
jgi:hypothetical protein